MFIEVRKYKGSKRKCWRFTFQNFKMVLMQVTREKYQGKKDKWIVYKKWNRYNIHKDKNPNTLDEPKMIPAEVIKEAKRRARREIEVLTNDEYLKLDRKNPFNPNYRPDGSLMYEEYLSEELKTKHRK